jgi:hypothetical protein
MGSDRFEKRLARKAFMDERALRTVWKLSQAARWRRLRDQARTHAVLTTTLVTAAFAAAALLLMTARSPAIRDALSWLIQNLPLAGLSSALYALLFVARRRAHLRAEHADSWLLAAPIPRRAFVSIAVIRIGLAVSVHALVLVAATMTFGLANHYAIGDLRLLVGAMLLGVVAGSILGAVWPVKQVARHEESRFVRKVRNRAMLPSLAGLSHWPIAKAIAWHRPENARVLFIVAALSVPVGTPALLGIAILAVWTLGSYLLAVVRAMPVVAREASIWLRPTMLPFGSFAWAIGARAFMHQAVGTVLLSVVFVSLGGGIADVMYFASLWLAATLMIGMIAIRQSYLSLPSFGRSLLSVLVVLVAESRARGWGLPVAALLAMAHMRGTSRGRA